MSQEILDAFHTLAYANLLYAKREPLWRGVPICKLPSDLWTYQEIIFETKPHLIIETGTWSGGSAIYLAAMQDTVVEDGTVITIDITHEAITPDAAALLRDEAVFDLVGSSTSDNVLERVRSMVNHLRDMRDDFRVMVILDSDHSKDHVLAELRAYAPFVTKKGSYIVVEDGNVNGHPVLPDYGPGPYEAVEAFLQENDDFEVDRARDEKFLVSLFPSGFLRRK